MVHRRSRRWPWYLLLAAGFAGFWIYRATRDPWPAEQGIAVPPGEDGATARIVAAEVAAANSAHAQGRPFPRSLYAKSHACVRATVSVPELAEELRHGLFARPAEYPAWIRFSSGETRQQSDQRHDVRGFALKVMGVPGAKLIASEKDADTQDFVLATSPRFFVPSVSEYALFLAATAERGRWGYFFDGSFLPWRWRVRSLYLALRMRRTPPASLLQTEYYSMTAFRLGPRQFVKYSVRPCQPARPPRRNRTENMLREGLREELRLADACFELGVQSQVLGKNMPVEDPTVLWSEKDSKVRPVARVAIPKQSFGDPAQDRLCEDLSFTPWHALPEHEPVGGINRVRRAVYTELSRYRHARNGAPRAEPRGFCLDLGGATCASEEGVRSAVTPSPSPATTASPSPAVSAAPRARKPRTAPSDEAPPSPEPEAVPTATPETAPEPEPPPQPTSSPPGSAASSGPPASP